MKFEESKNEIVHVPIGTDKIEAIQREDHKIMVGIKNVCKAIGVDFAGQLRNLKTYQWTCVDIMSIQLQDGQARRVAMIDLESLPMWLVTISASKVKPEVREKLLKFQREAKAILSAWFLGTSADMPTLATEMKEWKQKCIDKEIQLQRRDAQLDKAAEGFNNAVGTIVDLREEVKIRTNEARILYQPAEFGDTDYYTIKDYAERFGVRNKDGSRLTKGQNIMVGKQVTKLARSIGNTLALGTGFYGLKILNAWRVQRDMKIAVDKHDEVMRPVAFDQS